MSIKVSYNTLANQLEKELSITVRTLEDPIRFRRKLSQAKHRQHIEGKLIFSVEEATEVVDGVEAVVYSISVALQPVKNAVAILGLSSKGEL